MSEQAALDKKAIRKEILALIIPIILESILYTWRELFLPLL